MTNENRYRVILADPPWDYRNGGNGRARAHYDLMTIDDICAIPVKDISHDDAVLLMWTTWPQIEGAMKVVVSWGFEYISGFPWVKLSEPPMCDMFGNFVAHPTWGTGAWVRGCSEPIFICKRGNAKPPQQSWLGLLSKRMYHSRKPDSIYDYAESFQGPYIELFARRKRDGWTSIGNGIDGKNITDSIKELVLI